MRDAALLNVYELPTADNVCNQILREVMSIKGVSLAHVTMNVANVSLLHQHREMSEIYVILSGEGILYSGNQAFGASPGASLVIPPRTPHKLRNTGNIPLEHLVLASPPFNHHDVYLLEDDGREPHPLKTQPYSNLVTALDGTMVYELLSPTERKDVGIGLAIGSVLPGKDAMPHYHAISEEIYYIISGRGNVKVNGKKYEVLRGSVIYVPTNAIHELQNSANEELKVLCLSSPAYTDEDFIIPDSS